MGVWEQRTYDHQMPSVFRFFPALGVWMLGPSFFRLRRVK